MDTDINKLKSSLIKAITNSTVLFGIVYIVAIFMNGLGGTNIDTGAIIMGYGIVAGKDIVNHTVNSTLNSEKGVMPTKAPTQVNSTTIKK